MLPRSTLWGPVALAQVTSTPCIRQRQAKATPLVLVSAAGPWGSGRSRDLTTKDDGGGVVAPAVMPNGGRPGHTPTAGTPATGPAPARRGPHPGLGPCPRRCSAPRPEAGAGRYPPGSEGGQAAAEAFLLRHDLRSPGRAHGRPAHRRWRSEGVCPTPAPQIVFQAYGQTVTAQTERLGRLALARHEQGKTWR